MQWNFWINLKCTQSTSQMTSFGLFWTFKCPCPTGWMFQYFLDNLILLLTRSWRVKFTGGVWSKGEHSSAFVWLFQSLCISTATCWWHCMTLKVQWPHPSENIVLDSVAQSLSYENANSTMTRTVWRPILIKPGMDWSCIQIFLGQINLICWGSSRF